MLFTYQLQTQKEGLYPVTQKIKEAIRESRIKDGLVVAYCPHTTAGMTINENADPDVATDLLYGLNHHLPDLPGYRHMEGNSAAHLKSSLIGTSVTMLLHQGNLVLGVWQGVYFCEFDGPRTRQFHVSIVEA